MQKSSSVDEWLSQIRPSHRPIAERLRSLIKSVEPEFRESIKWGNPVYSLAKDALYIADQAQYVQLGFFAGSAIPDPYQLVEGTGSNMRHIKLRRLDEEMVAQLRQYVRNAAQGAA